MLFLINIKRARPRHWNKEVKNRKARAACPLSSPFGC
jgi:hypothetical protein